MPPLVADNDEAADAIRFSLAQGSKESRRPDAIGPDRRNDLAVGKKLGGDGYMPTFETPGCSGCTVSSVEPLGGGIELPRRRIDRG